MYKTYAVVATVNIAVEGHRLRIFMQWQPYLQFFCGGQVPPSAMPVEGRGEA